MRFLDVVKSIEKKDINGIYVFYGEEPYLNKMISKKIIKRYLSPVNEYMNLNVFESENLGFDSIVSSCETLPFFSEKRIVLIKGMDLSKENLGKRNVFFESLIKYSENIPKTTILIVEAGQKFMKGNFYNSLKKLDRIFELEKLNRNDLMNFISNGLAKKNISKNVMNYYIDRTGYLVKGSEVDLYTILNYTKKLNELSSFNLTEDSIKDVIKPYFDEKIYMLLNFINEKKLSETINLLDNYQKNNIDFYKIFYMIKGNFKKMIYVKSLLNEKNSYEEIKKQVGVTDYALNAIIKNSKNFTDRELFSIYHKIYKLEKDLKSIKFDKDLSLLNLVTEICQKNI